MIKKLFYVLEILEILFSSCNY